MPRLALVYIPDNHTPDDVALHMVGTPDSYRLVGLYDLPKRSQLTCPGSCPMRNDRGWTRDPFGFMKCGVCGSRNKRIRRAITDALFDWLGANLLGQEAPALFRTHPDYGPHRATMTHVEQ